MSKSGKITATEEQLLVIGLTKDFAQKLCFMSQELSYDWIEVVVYNNTIESYVRLPKSYVTWCKSLEQNEDVLKQYMDNAKPPKEAKAKEEAKAKPLTDEEKLLKQTEQVRVGLEEMVEPMLVIGGIMECAQKLLQSEEVITIIATAICDINNKVAELNKNKNKVAELNKKKS